MEEERKEIRWKEGRKEGRIRGRIGGRKKGGRGKE